MGRYDSSADSVIDIPSEDVDGRRIIGIADFAFEGDEGLTEVKIPGNVRHIGCWAFSGCELCRPRKTHNKNDARILA